jgi:hypothetical protein
LNIYNNDVSNVGFAGIQVRPSIFTGTQFPTVGVFNASVHDNVISGDFVAGLYFRHIRSTITDLNVSYRNNDVVSSSSGTLDRIGFAADTPFAGSSITNFNLELGTLADAGLNRFIVHGPDLLNFTEENIDAINNWYGTPEGPFVVGPFNYTPFLTMDPRPGALQAEGASEPLGEQESAPTIFDPTPDPMSGELPVEVVPRTID